MKRQTLLLLFFFVYFALSSLVEAKPFNRVLVLSGGGMQTATFLGIIETLEQKNWKPDLIISTCGSSIAAAIYNSKGGDIEKAKEYLYSPEYSRLMQSVSLNRAFALPLVFRIFNNDMMGAYPDVFSNSILKVPLVLNENFVDRSLDKPFSTSGGTPVIIIAANAKFKPENVGNKFNSKKLFYESLFTDPQTALSLPTDYKSPIAEAYNKSYVEKEISLRTDLTTFQASRASISDPYLINPMNIDGEYFFTGGIDLYPIELASEMGDEVIVTFGGDYDKIEVRAIQNTFGYDPNVRLKKVMSQSVLHWIDLSDEDKFNPEIGFDPQQWFLWLRNLIPKESSKFKKKIDDQWALGKERAIEALSTSVNSKYHIRHPVLN